MKQNPRGCEAVLSAGEQHAISAGPGSGNSVLAAAGEETGSAMRPPTPVQIRGMLIVLAFLLTLLLAQYAGLVKRAW